MSRLWSLGLLTEEGCILAKLQPHTSSSFRVWSWKRLISKMLLVRFQG